ncbi:MAG: DUF2079 domain-containing protein [Cyanothece sp. SIO1E1]|nr:DUF2079 domain-containing protein [Cyanothece sp. SIO1E1]
MVLRHLQKYPGLRVTVMAAIAFFVIVLAFSLYRYHIFYADSDHGIFSQVFWNSSQGRFFQSSISSTYSVNIFREGDVPEVFYHRLAQHFTPALLLWVPFYILFPSPITLIVLKTALVAAAGLVLYALSRQYLNSRMSGMIALSFYGANTVIGPILGEFYDFCQIPLFVFGLLLAMEQRWWWLFSILVGLTLAVREDAGLVVLGVGLYLILSKRYPRIGLTVCAVSLTYMAVLTNWIMPLFAQEVPQRFMIEEFGQYTNNQDASTLEVIGAMLSQPQLLLAELFSPVDKTIRYLLGHGLPLAFIPVLSPEAWIISGFPLAENLLRQTNSPLDVNIRFTSPIVPGLFYGAILWWSKHESQFKASLVRNFWTVCICLSLLLTFTSNPHRAWSFIIPDSIDPWLYVPPTQQWQHASQLRSLLAQIPPDASVSSSRYIAAHIPNRRAVLRFPLLQFRNDAREVTSTDYIIVDFWYPAQFQSVFGVSRRELQSHIPAVTAIVEQGEYGVIDFKNDIILMRRGADSDSEAIAAWLAFKQKIEPVLNAET